MKKLKKGQKIALVVAAILCMLFAFKLMGFFVSKMFYGLGSMGYMPEVMYEMKSEIDRELGKEFGDDFTEDMAPTMLAGKGGGGIFMDGAGYDVSIEDRSVVRNGSLDLIVESVGETAGDVKRVAQGLGGYVTASNVYSEDRDNVSGYVTVKVPSDMFDTALRNFKDLSVDVISESENMHDVTDRVIDLEARLVNLEAQEEQYLGIMEEATNVGEILQVTQYLTNVRYQIERAEAQLKGIEGSVEMSTVSVSLTSEEDVEVFGVRWKPLFVVKRSFRRLLEGVTEYIEFVIAFVFALPVMVLWVVTIGAIVVGSWKVLKFLKTKMWNCCGKKTKKNSKKK